MYDAANYDGEDDLSSGTYTGALAYPPTKKLKPAALRLQEVIQKIFRESMVEIEC